MGNFQSSGQTSSSLAKDEEKNRWKVSSGECKFYCTVRDTYRELTCQVTFYPDSLLVVVKRTPTLLYRDDHFIYRKGKFIRPLAWRGMHYIQVGDHFVRLHFAHHREEPMVEFIFQEASEMERFVTKLISQPFLRQLDSAYLEAFFGRKRFATIAMAANMLGQCAPLYLINVSFIGFDDVPEHNARTREKIDSAIIKEVIRQYEHNVWHLRYLMNCHHTGITSDQVVERFCHFSIPPVQEQVQEEVKVESISNKPKNGHKNTKSIKRLYELLALK